MFDENNTSLFTEDEAAAFLRLKSQTLACWRSAGRYDLPFVRVGRAIRYRRCDLERWLEQRTVGAAMA